MTCPHNHLWRLEGPIHEHDDPPTYQCQECGAFLRAKPDAGITVSYGVPQKTLIAVRQFHSPNCASKHPADCDCGAIVAEQP